MNKPTTPHDNITPEMKAANHAICTLASAMRDCEHCPFKPVQPAKATKPAFGNISGIIHPAHLRVIQPLGGSRSTRK